MIIKTKYINIEIKNLNIYDENVKIDKYYFNSNNEKLNFDYFAIEFEQKLSN